MSRRIALFLALAAAAALACTVPTDGNPPPILPPPPRTVAPPPNVAGTYRFATVLVDDSVYQRHVCEVSGVLTITQTDTVLAAATTHSPVSCQTWSGTLDHAWIGLVTRAAQVTLTDGVVPCTFAGVFVAGRIDGSARCTFDVALVGAWSAIHD